MRILRGLVSAVCVTLAAYSATHAQAPPSSPAPARSPIDISGFWGLSADGRKVPTAKLAPGVTRATINLHARKDAHAVRWCNLLGTPFVMDAGTPIDIRQGTSAIIIANENGSAPRYLYLNRQNHISAEIYDPSTNGDSIARWEGETLVADTVGFHGERGVTSIPGGGFKTDKSRLVERYRLLSNGSVLSATFTWTDPKVFASSHTYEFRYYRMPKYYEPLLAFPCNPYDEDRAAFLGDPAPFKAETTR